MDQEELETAVNDFSHTIGLLIRRMRAATSTHGLSLTQVSLMARLDRGGPATISDLARCEGMKPQSMGAVVASLEEIGIVERRPHPTDGRQVIIDLTSEGSSIRKSTVAAKRAWLTGTIARLSEEQQKTIFAAGDIIRSIVEP